MSAALVMHGLMIDVCVTTLLLCIVVRRLTSACHHTVIHRVLMIDEYLSNEVRKCLTCDQKVVHVILYCIENLLKDSDLTKRVLENV